MARSTLSEVVQRIRRQASAGFRYEVNTLGSALNDSSTTFALTYDLARSIIVGAVLSVDAEDMRVMAFNVGSKEVTVLRGWQDSIAAAHSSGAEVMINPRFTGLDIYEAIFDEILSWPPQLYRIDGDDFAVSESSVTIDIPDLWVDMIGVINCLRNYTLDGTTAWPTLPIKIIRGKNWDVGGVSGIKLRALEPMCAGTVHVDVARPFDLSTATLASDLVVDLGLQPGMIDLIQIGVKLRLIGDQEIHRSQRRAQDDSRAAEQTPPGAAIQSFPSLYTTYLRRRNEEISKLQARYPIMVA